MKKELVSVVAIVIVTIVVWLGLNQQKSGQRLALPEQVVFYACSPTEVITAGFTDNFTGVALLLPDGREFTLEQTISASGVRYANEGEQIVFHTKGETAVVMENGTVLWSNCVQTTTAQ